MINNLQNATLEEASQHIVEMLADWRGNNEASGAQRLSGFAFQWQGRSFLARPSLEVLELRGSQICVTGTSILLERAMATHRADDQEFASVVSAISGAEESFAQQETGSDRMGLMTRFKDAFRKRCN